MFRKVLQSLLFAVGVVLLAVSVLTINFSKLPHPNSEESSGISARKQ